MRFPLLASPGIFVSDMFVQFHLWGMLQKRKEKQKLIHVYRKLD